MTKEDRLNNANKHCFYISVNDSGSELCKANAKYGIAAIHFIQQKLGLKPDASFIGTPDMTITRNTTRWKSGFGYGGKITWGGGKDEFVILNVKPNACGMLVGGIEEIPDAVDLINRIHDLEASQTYLDGIKIEWDFYKSNHFIDIFLVKPLSDGGTAFSPYAFIIHGSACEFTNDNNLGYGLYIDKSSKLQEQAESMDTPFGKFYFLTGEAAEEYYKRFKYIEDFTKKKRVLAAKKLFGDFINISNESHQALINPNEMILGCNYHQADDQLFPLTLRGDLPAYLVKGVQSLSPECIEALGFEKRAKTLGIYDRLLNANIFPHGGGYNLPDVLSVNRVIEIGKERYFDVEMHNDRGKKIISEVRELPFEYRGRTVVLRALEINLFEIAAKLIPQYVFKI